MGGRIQNGSVREVDGFAAQFQALVLGEREALDEAQVQSIQAGSPNRAVTARAKGAGRRSVRTGVKPLITANRRILLTENCTGSKTVCPAAARACARGVVRSNGQGESAVQA